MNSKAYMMEELSRLWPELEKSQIEEGLEVPKDKKMGDLAFPCFRLQAEGEHGHGSPSDS